MGAGKIHAIVVLLLSFSILSGSVQAKYSGGTGSPEDPYLISTAADMNQIGRNYTDWDKCFKLTADINLSAYTGTQFSRIGTDANHAFSGVFDGNGHTISGFTYTAEGRDYIGVFGNNRGIIENVSLVDVNVTGRSYVGGLVGNMEGSDYGSEISNCNSTGVIRGGDNSWNIGGLVGCASTNEYWCYINNCYSTSAVTSGNGSAYLGGLVGQIVNSDISNCSSTGAVTGGNGSYYLGGLVGGIGSTGNEYGSEGDISNCYSTGAVTGGDDSYDLGGLVGGIGSTGNDESYGNISDCYSTGNVAGGYNSNSLGGLVGGIDSTGGDESWSEGDISNCYSTGTVTGRDDSYDLGGLVGGIGPTGNDESYGNISDCYSKGTVSGGYNSDSLGGLVGCVYYGDVADCYATGEVAGDYDAGGLVGLKEYYSTITTCYSSGSVSGYMFVGGLVGWDNGEEQETTDSFWDTNTSGQSWSAGGTGKTTAEMMTKSTFTDAGWNFDDVWHICETTNYPKLLWQILPADLVCPDGVNFVDFAFFAKRWLNTGFVAPTSHSIVIGNWESPDSNDDGWGPGSNDPCAILVPDSNIGVTLGHGSLKLTPGTDGAYWGLTWQGAPLNLTDANFQFDLTMVASEWGNSAWTQVGDKIAINSNGPSGWKEYGPASSSLLAYSFIDRDTGLPTTRDWGPWLGDANKTYSYDISDYHAKGATWMQIQISVQDGNLIDGGSFYFDKAQVTSTNASPNADFDLSGTVDIADLEIFCNEWLKEEPYYGYQKYTLTINIEGSGSVSKDPNQATYSFGETVQLTANPATGGSFDFWSGKVKNNTNNPITITMYGNMTITAYFTYVADTTPPTPNPMMWASAPAAISDTQITMTATTATDATSPPVEYYFTNVTDASHNSGWLSSPTYIDTGLTSDTNYTYTVTARDSAAVPNLTVASAPATARTNKSADTNAPTPNPMTWAYGPNAVSDTQITMTATTATDAQGPVQYYFTNKNDPNHHNSGWQLSTTYTDTGLVPDTNYGYTVKARDNALVPNITVESIQANATTLADTTSPTPNPMTFAIAPYATGPTTIAMQATTATDASGTVFYRFRNSASLGVLRDWSTDANFVDTGLTENTIHSYQVQAKDAFGNTTAWSVAAAATTSITLQTQINNALTARGGSPYPPMIFTAAAGMYFEDLEINEPNVILQSASGSAATIIQLQSTDANGIRITATDVTIGGSAGHGFTIKSAATGTDALIGAGQNNTEVSYCDLNSVGSASKGVRIDKATNVTIANNNFVNDGNGVYLGNGLVKFISITNNMFTKSGTDANFVKIAGSDANIITITANTADHGMAVVVGPNDTNLVNLTISNNAFSFGGILVYEPVEGSNANRLKNVTISNNTFAFGSQDSALRIDNSLEPNDVDWATLTFTNNLILRTPGGTYNTVNNAVSAALNAKHNYWGDATGPTGAGLCGTTGASVSTNVTFNPFWTTSAMTTDANCPAP